MHRYKQTLSVDVSKDCLMFNHSQVEVILTSKMTCDCVKSYQLSLIVSMTTHYLVILNLLRLITKRLCFVRQPSHLMSSSNNRDTAVGCEA